MAAWRGSSRRIWRMASRNGTNQPLPDVYIFLNRLETEDGEDFWGGMIKKITNKNGKFKFENLEKGKYFLIFLKKGYSVYGPISRSFHMLPLELQANFTGLFATHDPSEDDVDIEGINTFYLREGRIKYLSIKLKRESILIIKKMVKLPQRSYYLTDSSATIKHEKFLDSFSAEIGDNGEFKSSYLPAGKVKVGFGDENDPSTTREVTLVSGQTKTVEYIEDYTTGTVVHGTVKDKITGEPIEGVSVQLRGGVDGHIVSTNKEGEFWINKIKSKGTYILIISRPIYNEQRLVIGRKKDRKKVEIRENVINTIVFFITK